MNILQEYVFDRTVTGDALSKHIQCSTVGNKCFVLT